MTSLCINVLVIKIKDSAGDARLVEETLKGDSDPAYRVKCVDRLSIGLGQLADGGVDAVSYTHLDVYKRQHHPEQRC